MNVQHGPDNLSGGYADGAQYGALCAGYFARTPLGALPRWDVVTFNFGLHDQDPHESVDSYADNLRAIATTRRHSSKMPKISRPRSLRCVQFTRARARLRERVVR